MNVNTVVEPFEADGIATCGVPPVEGGVAVEIGASVDVRMGNAARGAGAEGPIVPPAPSAKL